MPDMVLLPAVVRKTRGCSLPQLRLIDKPELKGEAVSSVVVELKLFFQPISFMATNQSSDHMGDRGLGPKRLLELLHAITIELIPTTAAREESQVLTSRQRVAKRWRVPEPP
jgi:hypothetical protein